MMHSHMTGFVTEQEKSWGLILVVMDDALARLLTGQIPSITGSSLNPCCNG